MSVFPKSMIHWDFSPILRDTVPDFIPDTSTVFVIRSLVESISDKNYQMKGVIGSEPVSDL